MNAITAVPLGILSGILLCASFPPLGLSFLTWIALVPLFLALAGKSAIYGFLLSLLTDMAFFLGVFNWILEVPGYGFKRFDTFSESGIGDIEAGLKYQYLKTEDWRLASTFGVRFPTGEVDDPDDLADLSFGDGQYDLLLRLHHDYTGFKNLVLNGTFRYELKLPDEEELRVPDDANQPITANKEKVDRDLWRCNRIGGIGEIPVFTGIQLLVTLQIRFWVKRRDFRESRI